MNAHITVRVPIYVFRKRGTHEYKRWQVDKHKGKLGF